MWLLKINGANGDTLWTRNFGRDDHDHLERVKQDPVDNAILLCGHSVAQPYVKKSYFLKIDESGGFGPLALNENNLNSRLTVFPNPTEGALKISTDQQLNNIEISVTNYLGKLVFLNSNVTVAAGQSQEIDLSHEQPGIYFLTVGSENGGSTRKVVLK